MDADTVSRLITAAADVVLVMDVNGVIQDAAFGNDELLSHGYSHWMGKPWIQTVSDESKTKVNSMLFTCAEVITSRPKSMSNCQMITRAWPAVGAT